MKDLKIGAKITLEIVEEFLNNFKDLIEQAGDLI